MPDECKMLSCENGENPGIQGCVPDNKHKVPPPTVRGCTNPAAINYNPNAQEDDGSCKFAYATLSIGEDLL